MKTDFLIASGLAVAIGAAHAATNSAERTAAFAVLPDWQGIWETEWQSGTPSHPSGRFPGVSNEIAYLHERLALLGHPPYNDEFERRHQALLADTAALSALAASAKGCTSEGFPMAMSGPWLFQIVVTPEETLVVLDTGEVRHIYTDGRAHPPAEDLWPTAMGDSIGYWEDDTLVIDTIARTSGPVFAETSANLSEQAHFIERIRMIDPDTIESQMRIEDPERFTQPWQLTLQFSRVQDLDRLISWGCENDRNPVVDGVLTIAPP